MSPRMEKIEVKLQNWFSNAQRVVIAGIGNPLRKDDSIGIEIVRKLRNRVPKTVFLIECETVPENYIDQITEFKPTHILIVDAAYLYQRPGASELIDPEQMTGNTVSTHALPLQIFCEYLTITTKARISLLAIQPRNTCFGEGLTPELEKSAEKMTDMLTAIMYRALTCRQLAKPKCSRKGGQALYTSLQRRQKLAGF